EPLALADPLRGLAEGVGDIRCSLKPGLRHQHHRIEPQVPGNQKSDALIEAELGPLIESPLQRHAPAQMNYDNRRRSVEENNGRQPEDYMERPEFGRHAHPGKPHDKEDLREHEVSKAQLFFKLLGVSGSPRFFDWHVWSSLAEPPAR